MNRAWRASLLIYTLLAAGCVSIKDHQDMPPSVPGPAAVQNTVKQKTNQFKQDKAGSFSLPEALGGVVASDSWVIYKDQEEEEFEGNVSYDNGIYIFRSQYALSQRKLNKITARGRVFVRKNNPDKSFYELYAGKVIYNYQTGQGRAETYGGEKVKLVYQTAKGARLAATAQKAVFNTKESLYQLTGNVHVTHTDEKGQISTLKASKATIRPQEQHLLLEGGAAAENGGYTLKSQTLVYDGVRQEAAAAGGRPLMQGTTPDGTFAIIADRAEAETDSRKIKLSGRVQGWTVSEQVNSSKANKNF